MLLDGNFQDSDFLEDEEPEPEDEYGSRPVPGLAALLVGAVPLKPYPQNIYNIDGESHSGIAGTLYPSGEFVPLDADPAGAREFYGEARKTTSWWSDACACKVEGEVVWDGVVWGSIYTPDDPDMPLLRLWDGSILGDWPNHPPKAEKVVNPEKARLAAEEAERDKREWN